MRQPKDLLFGPQRRAVLGFRARFRDSWADPDFIVPALNTVRENSARCKSVEPVAPFARPGSGPQTHRRWLQHSGQRSLSWITLSRSLAPFALLPVKLILHCFG